MKAMTKDNERIRLILSIKPEYVDKIFEGIKKFEFRKHKPKFTVNIAYIYETAPVSKLIGYVTLGKIREGTPYRIWKDYGAKGGISKEAFDQYFEGKKKAYAIPLVSPKKYLDPTHLDNPPQSFRYAKSEELNRFIEVD